jgi:CheY-like chemotaxis protein
MAVMDFWNGRSSPHCWSSPQLPGSMDGLRLARVVRNRWPPIELILTSGLMKIGQRDLPERSVFLAKPYSLDALTAALTRFGDGP